MATKLYGLPDRGRFWWPERFTAPSGEPYLPLEVTAVTDPSPAGSGVGNYYADLGWTGPPQADVQISASSAIAIAAPTFPQLESIPTEDEEELLLLA